jgi:hypothetical protein
MFHIQTTLPYPPVNDTSHIQKIYDYNTNNGDNSFNTILYKMNMSADKLLSCNLKGSKIISCKINQREIKNLTYTSILSNICIIYNLPFRDIINDNDIIMRKIVQFITSYNISFEIIIKLHNYQFIEYKHPHNIFL